MRQLLCDADRDVIEGDSLVYMTMWVSCMVEMIHHVANLRHSGPGLHVSTHTVRQLCEVCCIGRWHDQGNILCNSAFHKCSGMVVVDLSNLCFCLFVNSFRYL